MSSGPASTPTPSVVGARPNNDADDDEQDCWVPTPDTASRGGAAANASVGDQLGHERDTDHPDDDDDDDEESDHVLSNPGGGSLRRRLSDRSRNGRRGYPPAHPASASASASAAAAASASHQPVSAPAEDQMTNNANPDVSLLENLHATLTPSLLSAFLFLTQTTLSTTAHILTPPLHLTRTILLPTLYGAVSDLLTTITSPRVHDWFGTVRKSATHLWGILIGSPKGQSLRGHVGKVAGVDLLHVASTPATRRLLIETIATAIQCGEALHTPEFRNFLHHLPLWGGRLVDAASTEEVKQWMVDGVAMIWGLVELAVQEETVVGLAECGAYLVHALEMEHGVWRDRTTRAGVGVGVGGGGGRRRHHRHHYAGGSYADASASATADHDDEEDDERYHRAEAARRRRERARRNARRDGDGGGGADAVGGGGGGEIEEALLASLGDGYRIYGGRQNEDAEGGEGGDGGGDDDDGSRHHVDVDETMSLPSRVVLESPPGGGGGGELGDGLEPPSTGGGGDACSSIGSVGGGEQQQQQQRDGHTNGSSNNRKFSSSSSFANEACDVEFLRRRIAQRAKALEAGQKRDRARRGPGRRRGSGSGGLVVDIEEASHVSEFYRLVDQVSAERQAETVSNILGQEERRAASASAPHSPSSSKRTFYPRAAAAAGAGNENGQDTLQSRLEAYVSRKSRERAGIGVGGKAPLPRPTRGGGGGILSHRMVVGMLILWFLLGCAILGGFSCYGIYIFVFAPAAPPTIASVPLLKKMVGAERTKVDKEPPSAATPSLQVAAPTEIIVKIVREVVHVTPDGSFYHPSSGADDHNVEHVDTSELEEKIAEVAASAIQNAVTENNRNSEL